MAIGIYINCKKSPFIDYILADIKLDETRSKNVFKALEGKKVYLLETGTCSVPIAKGTAIIESVRKVDYSDITARQEACIYGTDYDIKPGQSKYFYRLANVSPLMHYFIVPADRINHGRSYTEFTAPQELSTDDFSDEVKNFVSSLSYGSELTPITLSDAIYNMCQWFVEGVEYPADMSPAMYMLYWNNVICGGEQ